MGRTTDRVLAAILAGIGCIGLAWLVRALLQRGGYWSDWDGGMAVVRLALLLALALTCLGAAARLWSRPAPAVGAEAFRFGRGGSDAPVHNPAPKAAPVLAALLVLGLVGWDFYAVGAAGPRPAPPQESRTTEIEKPAAEPEPEPQVAAETPAQPQAELRPSAPAAPAPPAATAEAEPPVVVPPPPFSGELDRPPEVALLPEPQQTVAPAAAPQPEPPAPNATGHQESIVWLALAPDGRTFMSASTDFTVKLWDFATRKLLRDLGRHKDMARTALYMPDGTRALTAGDDGEIVLRQLVDGRTLHTFSSGPHGGVRKLALSGDGRIAVSAHDSGAVVVWDIEARKVVHVLAGHAWPPSGVAVSPDGRRAVSGSIDGEMRLWDIEKGELIRTWKGHERGAYGIAFLGDGRRFVTGSGDTTIKLWNLFDNREIRRFNGHSATVYAIDVSKDGKTILSGALDGTARLWDIASGREVKQLVGHRGRVYAVAFGPDGTVMTGSDDRTIRIWPRRTGDQVAVIR